MTKPARPATPLDDEAAQSGMSVYLVERHIDMPPMPLTEGKMSFGALKSSR